MWVLNVMAFFSVCALIVLLGFSIFRIFQRSRSLFDTVKLTASAVFAYLLFYGSLISGVSIPTLLLTSIDGVGGLLGQLIIWICPAIVGFISSALIFRLVGKLDEGNPIAANFLVMLMSLLAYVMVHVAIVAVGSSGDAAILVPNISFVLGVIAVLIFDTRLSRVVEEFLKGAEEEDTPSNETTSNWRNDL